MLGAYQLDRAKRNLSGYVLLSSPPPLGVRTLKGCGCDCGGKCGTLRGLGANPTLTAAAALQQAIQMYSGQNLNPAQFQNPGWLSQAQSAIESANIGTSGGFGPDCSGVQAQPLQLFKTASGLSLSAAAGTEGILSTTGIIAATSTAGIALGAATLGAGLLISVIGMIFAHHAAAVQRDLNFGCSVWPAVDNAFAVIAQAVASGQTTPAAAAQALPEIYSQVMQAGGANGSISGPSGIPGGGQPINNSPWCNSNCELSVILLGMVLYWQAQYAAMQAPAPPAPVPAPAPMSSVAPIAKPVTVSMPAQPGSGSAGAGPASAPAVSTGSTLAVPAAAPSTALPSWMFIAAAAIVGLIAAEVV